MASPHRLDHQRDHALHQHLLVVLVQVRQRHLAPDVLDQPER